MWHRWLPLSPSQNLAEAPGAAAIKQSDPRDAEVTDQVWAQLQHDNAAAEAREKASTDMLAKQQSTQQLVRRLQQEESNAAGAAVAAILALRTEEETWLNKYAKARHEQARLEHDCTRRQQEKVLEKLRKQHEALEERRREEQEAQRKLRAMGVGCQSFWCIKQTGGYRRAGGSHYVLDTQLGWYLTFGNVKYPTED